MRYLTTWTLLTLYFSSLHLYGQTAEMSEVVRMKKLQFNQVDFGIGVDNDHYGSMSLDEISAFAKHPEEIQRDLSGLVEEATTVTRGAALYVNFGYTPLNKSTGTYRNDREWRFGVGLHSGKESMLSYKNEELDTTIVYCNLQSEITIEGAYLFKGRWGKRFHWYYGAGMSLGSTFNNQIMLIASRYLKPGQHPSEQENNEENTKTYAAKSVQYGRFYIPYGIGYGINNNLIIGFDFKTGIGFQKIPGHSVNYIKKTGAFVLGVKYRFG